MYHVVLAAVIVAAADVPDDGCRDLGLENEALMEEICGELRGIAKPPGATRTLKWNAPETETDPTGPTGYLIIDKAYRTDPRKTLELIERIKSAGGMRGSPN